MSKTPSASISSWGGKRPGAGRKLSGRDPLQPLNATVSPDTISRLDTLARRLGSTRSGVLRALVAEQLATLGRRPTAAQLAGIRERLADSS